MTNNFLAVNDIYAAICDCQLLHPDEQEQIEDEMAGIYNLCWHYKKT
jgi:hypothetical protein